MEDLDAINKWIAIFSAAALGIGFFCSLITYAILERKFVMRPKSEGDFFMTRTEIQKMCLEEQTAKKHDYVSKEELKLFCKDEQSNCKNNFCQKIDGLKQLIIENRKTAIHSYGQITRKYESSIKNIYDELKDDRVFFSNKLETVSKSISHLAGVIEGRGDLADIVVTTMAKK